MNIDKLYEIIKEIQNTPQKKYCYFIMLNDKPYVYHSDSKITHNQIINKNDLVEYNNLY